MRAVWSFWSKPYRTGRRESWASDWHHWLAWGLSVHAARQHYPDTALVTDDAGARILVDLLELPFAQVSTGLNRLEDADPEWWALGKIEAYRRQADPFVHIDTDVFLWKPLRPELEAADVLAQNPEPILAPDTCYRPDLLEDAVQSGGLGWLPREWRWYRSAGAPQRAECCGVFGGARVDFIRHYAGLALKLAADPRNRLGLARLSGKNGHMILLEQYLLSACLDYHAEHSASPFSDVRIGYVFDHLEQLYESGPAVQAGYTHLAAGTKQNRRVCRDLERRVAEDLPEFYARAQDRAHAIPAALAS